MSILRSRLEEGGGYLVLDGGLASELERTGHDLDHPLWSARFLTETPEVIAEVTRSFAESGADIVATATYQATFEGLARQGIDRKGAIDLLQRSVRLARKAVASEDEIPLVAASIGPYGAFLADGSEYRGDYGLSEKELTDFHRERISVLANTEADLVAFETFPSGPEVRAVSALMTNEFPGTEAWISCSCRNEKELWDGTPIIELADFIESHPSITAFGVNCVDPSFATGLVEQIRGAAPNKLVVVYPNAGKGWDESTGNWRGTDTPEEFAERAREWRRAGASIIGGCCLATPEHIRVLAAGSRQPVT